MSVSNRFSSSRTQWLVFFPAVLAGLLYILSLSYYRGTEDDYASLLLAEDIATNQQYRTLSTPDTPFDATIAPVYPMIMASILKISGSLENGILPTRILSLLFAVGFLCVTWILLVDRFGKREIFLIVLFTALSPYMLNGSGLISSAMCYALFSTFTLLIIDRWMFNHKLDTSAIRLVFVMLACTLIYYIHFIGIALVLSALVRLIGQRRYRPAWIIGLGFLFLIVPWNMWIVSQGVDTYLDLLFQKEPDFVVLGNMNVLDAIRRVTSHLWQYLTYLIPGGLVPLLIDQHVVTLFENSGLMPVLVILRLAISGMVIAGVYTLAHRKAPFIYYYVICYFILLSIWPWTSWQFVLPIIPLLWVALLQSMLRIRDWAADTTSVYRLLRICPVVIVIVTTIGSVTYDFNVLNSAHAARQGTWSPEAQTHQAVYAWLRENSKPTSVFMCIDTSRFYVWAGRQGTNPPTIPTREAVIGQLVYYDVDYVISIPSPGYRVKDLNAMLIEPMVSAYSDIFKPVYRSSQQPGVTIYAVSLPTSNRMALGNGQIRKLEN